jgi:hypothetical protein
LEGVAAMTASWEHEELTIATTAPVSFVGERCARSRR